LPVREKLTIRLTKKKTRFFKGLLLAITIGLACCLVGYFQLFSTLNQQSNDLLYRGKATNDLTETANKIVIVGIDDSSLAELGRFSSWPRSLHTKLINKLSDNKARVIVFDILFSEASPDDEGLANAIKKAGNVILPYAGTTDPIQTEQKEIIRPLKLFEESALATGHAYMTPDEDGVVRQLPLLIPRGDRNEASLALTTVAKYLRRPQIFDSPSDDKRVIMAGREIPLQGYGMLINYTNNPSSRGFVTVSYADVLKGTIAPDIFEDKIVIIGVTALGFGDIYWTPMGQALSGVEIHAEAINTILSGHFIRPASNSIMFASIILLALICGAATLRFRVVWSALSAVFLLAIYFLSAFYLFGQGLLINVFYPPLSVIAVFLGVSLYNVTSERIEKREITRTFGRYVSPSVVTKILNTVDEDSLKLGGEEYPVTVLFADVRNFTGFCEKNSTRVVVSTLNRYLSGIIEAISQYDGMVNKFGGDSVMAIWNAPIDCPEHALSATRAAIKAQQEIIALQSNASHLPKMEFGIGVNSGKVIVGNMGSLDRLEYSVIGDTVNTTARLAAAAPGGKIWIGPKTFEYVKQQFETIPLEPLALKGKGELFYAYEVSLINKSISDESQTIPLKTIKASV
jgi:adenylate cyclase